MGILLYAHLQEAMPIKQYALIKHRQESFGPSRPRRVSSAVGLKPIG